MPRVFPAVQHRSYDTHLLNRGQSLSPIHPASRPRGRKPSQSALPNQLPLKLCHRCEELKDEPACCGARVDLLFQADEVDASLLEPVQDLKEIADRAAQAVQSPYPRGYRPVPAGPGTSPTQADPATHHPWSPDRCACSQPFQIEELPLRVLLFGGHSFVPYDRAKRLPKTVQSGSTICLSGCVYAKMPHDRASCRNY